MRKLTFILFGLLFFIYSSGVLASVPFGMWSSIYGGYFPTWKSAADFYGEARARGATRANNGIVTYIYTGSEAIVVHDTSALVYFRYNVISENGTDTAHNVDTIWQVLGVRCSDNSLVEKGEECPPDTRPQDPEKQFGNCPTNGMQDAPNFAAPGNTSVGNPINIAIGNKYEVQTDYSGNGISTLNFVRTYNSRSNAIGALGAAWTHNYERSVSLNTEGTVATVSQGNGRVTRHGLVTGVWLVDPEQLGELTRTTGGWTYKAGGRTDTFDDNGRLVGVVYMSGKTETMTYDANGYLERVDGAAGSSLIFTYNTDQQLVSVSNGVSTWGYRYDTNGRLEYVDNPDGTSRQFHYENTNFANALTGMTDERGIRFATWGYDEQGRANLTTYANNAQRYDIAYPSETSRVVTDSRGNSTNYSLLKQNTIYMVEDISGPGCANCSGDALNITHDAYNRVTSKTKDGITTEFGSYDENGSMSYKVEAKGTADERRIDYTYDSRYVGKIATKSEPSVCLYNQKVTTYGYDDFGNTISVQVNGFTPDCNPVSRITTMAYDGPYHQLSQIDGPRTDVSDVTLMTYYPDSSSEVSNRARLRRVTLANGAVLRDEIQYSAAGKIQSEHRLNGVTISYTYYTGNNRLESIIESDGQAQRITHWTYLPTGEVETITTGYGTSHANTVTFGYDDARRLTSITDSDGNKIAYTLDGAGNREAENIFDATGSLKRSLQQTFDLYNRLNTKTQENETTDYNFAANGSLDNVIDGNGATTYYSYDSLNRLASITQDLGGAEVSTANALTQYTYDDQDNRVGVTDPDQGITTYQYDDLGNLVSKVSPDAGSRTYNYDAAGNVASMIDAKGQSFNYSYDALNRLTLIDTPYPVDDISYHYDTCINGVGRLCSVTQGSEATYYTYNIFGDVTAHQNTQYAYDALGRVERIVYPSGNILTYSYNNNNQIDGMNITINGVAHEIANNIEYAPFGPVSSLTYGNGLTLNQSVDSAYRLTSQEIPNVYLHNYEQYDGNGNLKLNRDLIGSDSRFYLYDALNRLSTDRTPTAADLDPSAGGGEPAGLTLPSPLASYHFDGNYNDTTGNGYDGVPTVYSFLNFVEGVEASALDFQYSFLKVEEMMPLENINNYSVSAWVKVLDIGNMQLIAMGQPVDTGNFSLRCVYYNTCGIYNQAGSATIAYDASYKNEWHHWAGTYENGTLRFYLDGQLVAENTNAMSPTASGESLFIGGNEGGAYTYFGSMDEVRIFDRTLTAEEVAVLATPPAQPESGVEYRYSLNGNRTGIANFDTGTSSALSYQANSNRLTSIDSTSVLQDANGNTISDGENTFVYNSHNRLIAINSNIYYTYNALGQRVSKNIDGSVTTYAYDTSGHLLGEYQNGNPVAEHIYLNGQPIAVVKNGAVNYVHTDHLGTPRVITDESQVAVWRWDNSSPFGDNTAVEDPDGDGTAFVYNPRFTGQYYDAETGLHYNYFRYYDPSTGRYITADPLGALIYDDKNDDTPELNHLYAYVTNNPLKFSDPLGLHHGRPHGQMGHGPVGTGISIGDAISTSNGNLWNGYTEQDWRCSGPACIFNNFPEIVERCINHDDCYQKNECNQSSWISNALGGTKSCNQCNSNF